MKKVILGILISSFSISSFAIDRCSEFTVEYKRVLSNQAMDQRFMNYFYQGLTLSEKQSDFERMSSDVQIKGISRVATYCIIKVKSGVDLKLSLAINDVL